MAANRNIQADTGTPKYVLYCLTGTILIAALGFIPAAAQAAGSGGVAPGTGQTPADTRSGGADLNTPAPKRKKRKASPPVITGFELASSTLFDQGRPITLRYRIKARAKHVRVRLILRTKGGRYVRTLELGVHRTRVLQTTALSQQELALTRAGTYKLRLTATDGKGRRAARAADVQPWLDFNFADHRFPVVGPFSFGGPDARYGVDRPGHIHQGQDVIAAEGTPLVAPHAGTITWVQYQAGGAGWYVVVDSADEDYDFVFMHLQTGSIEVQQGDVVPTGKLLGRVGATGDASGPHLHFEVWAGVWQLGGHSIDPLPFLQNWYATAPGGARNTDSAK